MTAQDVFRSFIASPEFNDRSGFVARCYLGIFNNNLTMAYDDPGYRVPDYAGLDFWTSVMLLHLAAGGSTGDAQLAVVEGFTSSDEWQERIGDLTDSEFVELLYERILGREIDPDGHAFWTDLLARGIVSRNELVLEFINSEEARSRYAHHMAVAACYLGLLGRDVEREGFVFWMDLLTYGASDLEVR